MSAVTGLCIAMLLMLLHVGTQRVISFLRQMVEHGGFYRTSDQAWVKFERIQFVGACNPPTDPGRKPLSHRSVCKYSMQNRLSHLCWCVYVLPFCV